MICEEYVIEELKSLKELNKNLTRALQEQETKINQLQGVIDALSRDASVKVSDFTHKKFIYLANIYEDEDRYEFLKQALSLFEPEADV